MAATKFSAMFIFAIACIVAVQAADAEDASRQKKFTLPYYGVGAYPVSIGTAYKAPVVAPPVSRIAALVAPVAPTAPLFYPGGFGFGY